MAVPDGAALGINASSNDQSLPNVSSLPPSPYPNDKMLTIAMRFNEDRILSEHFASLGIINETEKELNLWYRRPLKADQVLPRGIPVEWNNKLLGPRTDDNAIDRLRYDQYYYLVIESMTPVKGNDASTQRYAPLGWYVFKQGQGPYVLRNQTRLVQRRSGSGSGVTFRDRSQGQTRSQDQRAIGFRECMPDIILAATICSRPLGSFGTCLRNMFVPNTQ